MRKKNLTVKQIIQACQINDYIRLRLSSGHIMGINCKVVYLGKNKNAENKETEFVSYEPIGFQEYISIKHAFIN